MPTTEGTADLPFDPVTRDITCRRLAGDVRCNLPQRHRHHSPTGFEIGYGGSGPADLALNILARFLPLAPGDDGVRLWDGTRVSQAAWDLHQPFKWQFVATMDREEGGTLAGALIAAWIVAAQHAVVDDATYPAEKAPDDE
jgi:hypothetical protein